MTSQYPSAKFSRHWSPENPLGICSNGSCKEYEVIETSEHILLYCPAYNSARQNAIKLCLQIKNQHVHQLVTNFFITGPHKLLQFLLDCSVIPEVISMAQQHGNAIYNDLFYLGRTWCFGIHRMRMKRLCKWNFRWSALIWYLGPWSYLIKTTLIYQRTFITRNNVSLVCSRPCLEIIIVIVHGNKWNEMKLVVS